MSVTWVDFKSSGAREIAKFGDIYESHTTIGPFSLRAVYDGCFFVRVGRELLEAKRADSRNIDAAKCAAIAALRTLCADALTQTEEPNDGN